MRRNRVAKGDLCSQIEKSGNAELSILFDSLRAMNDSLSNIVSRVKGRNDRSRRAERRACQYRKRSRRHGIQCIGIDIRIDCGAIVLTIERC